MTAESSVNVVSEFLFASFVRHCLGMIDVVICLELEEDTVIETPGSCLLVLTHKAYAARGESTVSPWDLVSGCFNLGVQATISCDDNLQKPQLSHAPNSGCVDNVDSDFNNAMPTCT